MCEFSKLPVLTKVQSLIMEKTGTVKVEVHPMSLRSVVTVVPKNEEEKW